MYILGTTIANLIVGKKVDTDKITYLQGVKQRTLQQYKDKVYPELRPTDVSVKDHQELDVMNQRLDFLESSLEQMLPLIQQKIDPRIHIDFAKKQIRYPVEMGSFTVQAPKELDKQLAMIKQLIGKDPLQIIQVLSQLKITDSD
jgi:hypothetical protein